jgi:hypothetical protein
MYDTLAPDVLRKNDDRKGHSLHTCGQKVCRNLCNHNAKLPLLEIERRFVSQICREPAKRRNDVL